MGDLEAEIQCPICYDIFIEPAVVSCGHLFCQFCIEQWSLRVNECPICRLHINNMIKITNGNTIVDLAAELMSVDVRNRRVEAVKQRDIDRSNYQNGQTRRYYPNQNSSSVNRSRLIVIESTNNQFSRENNHYNENNRNPFNQDINGLHRHPYNNQRYSRYHSRGYRRRTHRH